ncbi:MAG: HNH endonuclease [Dehalococcoidia bacterium]|nr:HNH endonuclease [Dehalococcoidia bacterium]
MLWLRRLAPLNALLVKVVKTLSRQDWQIGKMKKPYLTIELVPKGQWGANLRSELPRAEWDRLRKATYKAARYRCEICGGKGPKWPVECHERWHYDEETKAQKLLGLIALCPRCHEVKHIGRAQVVGRADKAIEHLMEINGWDAPDALEYVEGCFAVWARRSQEQWSLDLSWLEGV